MMVTFFSFFCDVCVCIFLCLWVVFFVGEENEVFTVVAFFSGLIPEEKKEKKKKKKKPHAFMPEKKKMLVFPLSFHLLKEHY